MNTFWLVRDIYERSEHKTCWVIDTGEGRYVPGDCSDCGGDTLVNLDTRRLDDGYCARCGAANATTFTDACRDSATLLFFAAAAILRVEPVFACSVCGADDDSKCSCQQCGEHVCECPDDAFEREANEQLRGMR